MSLQRSEEYVDGWEGITKKEYEKLYATNTAQWPVWTYISNGNGFCAEDSLRANGIHPEKVPTVLRDCPIASKLLNKIAQTVSLKFVETPA